MQHTVIIIGGGAAGIFAAIHCAESNPEAKVIVLEKTRQLLAKVRISGGGRCNVTHACFDPQDLVSNYPRGFRELLGPFYSWQPADTMDWFETRGIALKTEDDGRVFPATDDSETIVDGLLGAARDLGVDIRIRSRVTSICKEAKDRFTLSLKDEAPLTADRVLIATGGAGREQGGLAYAASLGHTVTETVPSLFTFHVDDPRIDELAGVSVAQARVSCPDHQLESTGPLLITHWGLSGPAILKLSALGAREFARSDYTFEIAIDWLPGLSRDTVFNRLNSEKLTTGRRLVVANGPAELPRRLWERLILAADIDVDTHWANLQRKEVMDLATQLGDSRFEVRGKSINKEEFVTCGGVLLDEVDFRRMESKVTPGLFFAGEVLDIDGVTGGFNFQAAWTTGMIAGEAMAESGTRL